MFTKISVICALVLLVSISGCVQQPAGSQPNCGDGVCGSGETIADCPNDCGQPPMPPGEGETGDDSPPELPF